MTRPVAADRDAPGRLDLVILLALTAAVAGLIFWAVGALWPDPADRPGEPAPPIPVPQHTARESRPCGCLPAARPRSDHAL